MRCWSLVAAAVFVIVVAGCITPEVERSSEPVGSAAELVELEPLEADGMDAAPLSRVGFRMEDGSVRPVADRVVGFASGWRDAAVIVDDARRLYEVHPSGRRRMLSEAASGSLAISPDGRLLVYVAVRDVHGELRVHDGAQERTLARDLASVGALRVIGTHVVFVGGASGGVAGVWAAALDGTSTRCLTNCGLATGTAWQDRHVPLPASAAALELSAGVVAWEDAAGQLHQAALAEEP